MKYLEGSKFVVHVGSSAYSEGWDRTFNTAREAEPDQALTAPQAELPRATVLDPRVDGLRGVILELAGQLAIERIAGGPSTSKTEAYKRTSDLVTNLCRRYGVEPFGAGDLDVEQAPAS